MEEADCLPAPLHTSRSHPCFLLPPPPSHSISLFFFLLLFLVAWFIHHFTKANHGIDFPSLHPPPCKAKHEAFMGLFPVRLKPSRRKFKGRGRFNYAVIYISRVLDWLGHSLPVWALLAYPCHVSSWHDCGWHGIGRRKHLIEHGVRISTAIVRSTGTCIHGCVCTVWYPIPYIVGMNLAIRAFQVLLSSVFSATPTNPDLRCSSMIRQWQKEKKKRTRCQLVLVETSGMHQIRIAGWHYYYVCMSRWTLTRQYHSRGFGALGGLLPAPWQYAACSTTK